MSQQKKGENDSKKAPPPVDVENEEQEYQEDFDEDEIDLSEIDPQILQAAQDMGITPMELIRQIQ